MELNKRHIAKIDPLLQEALAYAENNQIIRIIVGLDISDVTISQVISREQFSSRYEYRQALHDQQHHNKSKLLLESLDKLSRLSIKILGESSGPVLVIEGTPNQILKVLELSGVLHASLDKLIGLPELVPSEYVEYISNLYSQVIDNQPDEELTEAITMAAEQYILRYYANYGKIKILGMEKPIDLENIYTIVQFTDQPDFLRPSVDEINEQVSLKRLKSTFQPGEKKRGVSVANQTPYLMVLGSPGTGKSTFVRKIGLEAIKGKNGEFDHECLPILLESKQLNEETQNFENIIIEELRACNFPCANLFAEQALKQGKLLIIFDGLDEVPSESIEKINHKIQDLVYLYPKNRFICTCRTAAWQVSFIKFRYVEIADLDNNQIYQFIQNWFSSKADRLKGNAKKCWDTLNEAKHVATLELSRTPLLLTFICLVYENSRDLPKNRSTLYGEALDILLRKWWKEKQIESDPVFKKLDTDLEKIMLSEIAYDNFIERKLFFSRNHLLEQINESLNKNRNAPKELSAEAILDAVSKQQGILVERARNPAIRSKDLYSFSHLTIQEYLIAHRIANHRDLKSLVNEHITDQNWKDVFLLLVGLIPGRVDELLLLIESAAQEYTNTQLGHRYLLPLLQWTEEVTINSRSKLQPLPKRSLASAFAAANAYAYSYGDSFSRAIRQAFELAYPYTSDVLAYSSANKLAYAFSFANCHALACSFVSKTLVDSYASPFKLIYAYSLAKAYSHTLDPGIPNIQNYRSSIDEFISYARKIGESEIFNDSINITLLIARLNNLKDSIPSKEDTSSVHKCFSETIIRTWFDGFRLDMTLVNLPRKQLEEIGQKYFYLNWLMVQCSQIAVTVPTDIWNDIESRILVIP